MSGHPPIEVVHNAREHRFEARVNGLHCEASYEMIDGVMWMMHTGVPGSLEGRGIAAQLVRAALAHARAQGLKVHPACSYVRAYMLRRPETLDLMAV